MMRRGSLIALVAVGALAVTGTVGSVVKDRSNPEPATSSTSDTEARFRTTVNGVIESALPGFCEYMVTLSDAQAFTWMGNRIDNLGYVSIEAKRGLGSIYKQECARFLSGH